MHVVCVGELKTAYKICYETLNVGDHLGYVDLKYVKVDVK